MTTLAKLKKEAAKVGATVEKERLGITTTVRVTVAAGFIWNEGDVHEFVDDTYTGENDYSDLLSRMSYGCRKCDIEECEWCCEEID